jgi:hypothetical protein
MHLLSRALVLGALVGLLAAAEGVPEALSDPYRAYDEGIAKLEATLQPFGLDLASLGAADLRTAISQRMAPLAGIGASRTLAQDARVREVKTDLERIAQRLKQQAEQLGNHDHMYKELPAADLEAIAKGLGATVQADLGELSRQLAAGEPIAQQAQRGNRNRFQAIVQILYAVRQSSRQLGDQFEHNPPDPVLRNQLRESTTRLATICTQALAPDGPQGKRGDELPYQVIQLGDHWSRAWRACFQRQFQGSPDEVPALPTLVTAQQQAESALIAEILAVEQRIAACLSGATVEFPDDSDDQPIVKATARLERLHEIAQAWNSFEQSNGKLAALPAGIRKDARLQPILDGLEARRRSLTDGDLVAKLGNADYNGPWISDLRALHEQYQILISPVVELADHGPRLATVAALPAGDPRRAQLDAFITVLVGLDQAATQRARIEAAMRQLEQRANALDATANSWQERFWEANNRLQQQLANDAEQADAEPADHAPEVDPQAIVDALPEDPAPPKPGF